MHLPPCSVLALALTLGARFRRAPRPARTRRRHAAVALGDSFISGEAGRWQGNSLNPTPGTTAPTAPASPRAPACQVDTSRVYVDGTDADGCHRSDVAEILSATIPVDERHQHRLFGRRHQEHLPRLQGGEVYKGEAPQGDQLAPIAAARRTSSSSCCRSAATTSDSRASSPPACRRTTRDGTLQRRPAGDRRAEMPAAQRRRREVDRRDPRGDGRRPATAAASTGWSVQSYPSPVPRGRREPLPRETTHAHGRRLPVLRRRPRLGARLAGPPDQRATSRTSRPPRTSSS